MAWESVLPAGEPGFRSPSGGADGPAGGGRGPTFGGISRAMICLIPCL